MRLLKTVLTALLVMALIALTWFLVLALTMSVSIPGA